MNTTHSTGSVQACQNCKKDFLVDADNIAFCEKINVPLPTWCPPCRMTRRLAFPNAWGVYFRDCDKCKNKTLTMYSPKNQMTVYNDHIVINSSTNEFMRLIVNVGKMIRYEPPIVIDIFFCEHSFISITTTVSALAARCHLK